MSTGIDINFDGVETASAYEAVPPGKYLAAVRTAEVTTAGTGAAGMKLQFEVVGGPYSGAELRDSLWFSGKALPFVRQRLEALGVTIPAGDFRLTPEMLIGKRAMLTVREEEYEGRDGPAKTVKVKAYEPAVASSAAGGSSMSSRDEDIPFAPSWF